ncbi:PKD domain-containing protein [Aliikangiella sp. G2MR2-5]|uniref:PKD domain-containing protein n=1 Tax=Aliikangiella sp. G2MR2-5 TaxID=2788943 RepID=UPI0018A9EEA3|nr:PKD domain-containing protein [Aliikangiella sp. G2MR2-5]
MSFSQSFHKTDIRIYKNNNQSLRWLPKYICILSACFALALLTACGSGGISNSNQDNASQAVSNSAPSADAGEDQVVTSGDTVLLSGENSNDPDGDALTYQWSFTSLPEGSSADLDNAMTSAPSFYADRAGTYIIQLVVSDGELESSADSVSIVANEPGQNVAPHANAGNDKIAYTGKVMTLDASQSSDANGDVLSYIWSLEEKPVDSDAEILSSNTSSPSFTPDVEGSYVISLVVNDGELNSESDLLIINAAHWWINNSERSSYIKEGGQGVLVNVQSVATTSQNSEEFVAITATGIPDYSVTITPEDIDNLNGRPNAASDFSNSGGETIVDIGDIVLFGQSVGYVIDRVGCELGYWPPGPACPSNQSKSNQLPTEPQPSSDSCSTGLGPIGVMLNGTSVYNWDDGQSYNNQNVWNNLAPEFEVYDVDICLGHAQREGDYHHHMFSKCLQELMGDDGSKHSPIYGFAADGYPIHGPYYAQGILAQSAWVLRDYDNANSASGCGASGQRSCQLVDPYDLSKGTTSVSSGPATSDTVTSQSGNPIQASGGIYFEDFYYDASLTATGEQYLDEHNGHQHGNFGYHYHITVEDISGQLLPVFPYQVGPEFYGELPSGGIASCQ